MFQEIGMSDACLKQYKGTLDENIFKACSWIRKLWKSENLELQKHILHDIA
jgi:hypothetical protein